MPSDQWAQLHYETLTTVRYMELTYELRVYQRNHPNQEVFMTDQVEETQILTELSPNLIATIPGHIIFNTPQDAADGSNCLHRWIITEDDEIKCILCEGVRKLTPEELQIMETAEQAGVVFLKWPERFDAMERARGSKRRRGRKTGSKTTGGVKIGTEVPEGFIGVKTAAAKLGTDPKRLRKKIRSGLYEGIKIGGKVFVKLEA